MAQMAGIREWGGQFIVPDPRSPDRAVSFEPTAIGGARRRRPRAPRRRARLLRPHVVRGGVRRAGLPQAWSSAASRGTSAGTRCAACTGRPRPTARGSWCAARGAPSIDVVVDLRPGPPTYLEHVAVELDEENRRALFIPAGLAHGFLTLVDETEVFYQMDTVHVPDAARGARWDDPAFAIAWPAPPAVISDRDRTYPDFAPERPAVGSASWT